MPIDLDAFANVRARIQRLTDARFFSGWADHLSEIDCRIRLSESGAIQAGDQFLIELHGEESLATFRAVASGVEFETVRLQVTERIQFRTTTEGVRYRLRGIFGTVCTSAGEIDACIVDISRGGLGVIVPRQISRSSHVLVRLRTRAGDLKGEGQVRYCRPAPPGVGGYRIGLKLEEFHRLEKARWLREARSLLASLPHGSGVLAGDTDQTCIIASTIGGRFIMPGARFPAKNGMAGQAAREYAV